MIKNEMAMNQWIVQAEGSVVSDMDGEKVMLSIRNGKYYNLGEVGGALWDHLSTPVTVEQLINRLTEEFDVDRTVCERQTLQFLESLLEEGLIYTGEAGKRT